MQIEKKLPLKNSGGSVNFDIQNMSFDVMGLENYYWPLKRSEASRFGMSLVKAYAKIMRESQANEELVLPYKIMGKYFIPEAVGIFQGDLLRERLKADQKTPVIPNSWRLWPALMEKKEPEFPFYMTRLRDGPEQPRYSRKILSPSFFKKVIKRLKPGKGGVFIDGLRIKSVTEDDLKNAIIATQRTELIVAHAKVVEKEVVFCRTDRWFRRIEDTDIVAAEKQNFPFMKSAVMELVDNLYQEHGIILESHSSRYLDRLLRQGVAIISVHLDRLQKSTEILPRHIWTGSGGNIWDLMLRISARAQGAYVEAHDHGGGVAYLKETVVPFVEFWACDKFITYSAAQAALMQNEINQKPLLNSTSPKIESIPTSKNKKTKDQFLKTPVSIKKVIFMGTIYGGDRARPVMDASDVAVIDWQYRMISHLRSSGYDVVLKHHPDGEVRPPKIFEEDLGARIDFRPFEEMMMEGDLFIFDYTATSTLKSALLSNIPMILIDLEDFEWESEAFELVKRRLSYIKGWYDEDNRAQIDWRNLDQAIEDAASKCNDTAFIDRYYS